MLYNLQQFIYEKLEDTNVIFVQISQRLYQSAECIAKKWNCSVCEAQARIITEKPNHKKRMVRAH